MDLQPASRQMTCDVQQDLLRLRLRPTARDDIIRVPLERNVRVRGPHPVVEREVQEGVLTRSRLVLLLADGVSARAAEAKLDVSGPTIAKWRWRFLDLTNRHGIPAVEVDGARRAAPDALDDVLAHTEVNGEAPAGPEHRPVRRRVARGDRHPGARNDSPVVRGYGAVTSRWAPCRPGFSYSRVPDATSTG